MQIICSNLGFQNKINILRTLVDVSSLSEETNAEAKSKLRKLSEDSAKRNMIAHAPFRADTTKTGVEFFTVKARGKFETPNIVWSPEQFAKEIDELEDYTKTIDALQTRFKERPLTEKSYAEALAPLMMQNWPDAMMGPRGIPLVLMHSLPHAPASSQTPEKPKGGQPTE